MIALRHETKPLSGQMLFKLSVSGIVETADLGKALGVMRSDFF
jgi:hypothetical protein